jgi:predicted small lipoprotein YifL
MIKSCNSNPILTNVILILLVFALTGCGLKGRAYVKEADGSVGPNIADVNVTFTTDGGSYTAHATTDSNGNYKRNLKWANFGINASHFAFQPYDSAPTRYGVPWLGYKTVNIPMQRYDGTVIIVVRHAEKAPGSGNVNLAEDPDDLGIGVGRANRLATIAGSSDIAAAYATEWCRTAQTAQPSALLFNLTLYVIDSTYAGASLDSCSPSITSPVQLLPAQTSEQVLAQHILSNYAGQAVLVVGHSNTVGDIVRALSNTTACPVPDAGSQCIIPENEYHHMFVVHVPTNGTPTITYRTYGYVPQ